MSRIVLPALDALIELHAESIETYGGAPGLRDSGALDASLARARHILSYSERPVDVVDVAASVCASICRNHPFVDGNKRIAFIAAGVILDLNGLYLDARESEATETMTALAAGLLSETALTDWVRRNSHPA